MSFEVKPLKLRVVGCETFASRFRRWVARLRRERSAERLQKLIKKEE